MCVITFVLYRFNKSLFDTRILGVFKVDRTLWYVSCISWVVCFVSWFPLMFYMLGNDTCKAGKYYCIGTFGFSLLGIVMYGTAVIVASR